MFTVELKVGYEKQQFVLVDEEDVAYFVGFLAETAKGPLDLKIWKEED